MVKKVEGSTCKDSIFNNLHKDTENMINRKMKSLQEKSVSSLEKIQSIYNDELQILRKELESKNQIISKLLETIENNSNKAGQPNPQPIPHFHFEEYSNDKNESKREDIKVPEMKSTSNDQQDFHQ